MQSDAHTCALNAANEIAVAAFLARDLGFLGIAEVVERVLEETEAVTPTDYEHIARIDNHARRRAREILGGSRS
jgi:1-deoxy-D-xylulose-5-phosphate reductoisomerase